MSCPDPVCKRKWTCMKRILFVTTISGFLPQFEKNDVKLLKEMGGEIHYASNFENPVYAFDREELTGQGIRMHHIDVAKSPAKVGANARAVRQLKAIIDGEGIDMVHCHNPMGAAAARIAAAISKRKPYVIYTAHGFHFYKGAPVLNWLLFYPAEYLLAGCSDQIITINREDYRRACRFPLKKGGSVSQIHSVGVDRQRFRPRKELCLSKREELRIPAGAFHIVTAAELNANKNQRVVMEAIAGLPYKDIYYSICGKGPNEEALRQFVREKHLAGRVNLLGYRTDMEEVLQTADCFAFPSRREGLGVAAVEALLCSVPLIVADNRGTREYTIHGENGIVCRNNSVEDFREAIRFLYEKKDVREEMASKCRASAEKFTLEEVEKTMRGVYGRAFSVIETREDKRDQQQIVKRSEQPSHK